VCLLWRGAFAGGGLGCLKTACYHAFKRHEARSLGKELERRLWDADTLITPSRVAELTHTMYEMSFTSPNDPQRRRILLPMNGEQRKAYEPCTDLGIPIRETGKIWSGWVGPLPVDLDSTFASPYNAAKGPRWEGTMARSRTTKKQDSLEADRVAETLAEMGNDYG
jgi:hypothetical protein